jgi:hypothetical protein
VLFIIIGCGESKDSEQNAYKSKPLPQINHHESNNYNGRIDHLAVNSWVYTGFTNDLCKNKLNSSCRKIDSNYVDELASDRALKYSFTLTVNQYNIDEPPYWIIVFQDWVKILPLEVDSNGNHPITTLKLKVFNHELKLCHYDNSWQWGHDFGDNRSDTAIDIDHSLHQENTLNGCVDMPVGMPVNVDFIVHDAGKVEFYADNNLVSSKEYQTKYTSKEHVIQFGQYWAKGYNLNNDFDKQAILTIEGFSILERVND